jgi:hypothetical protein
MNIKKMFKSERGTHKEKVPVKRKSGTKYEYRRVGKKVSPRTGTGKIDKFPSAIKKEILDLRSLGDSGAKIKDVIENMIDHGIHVDQETSKKLKVNKDKYSKIHSKWIKETDPYKKIKLDNEMKDILNDQGRIINEGKSEVSTYINGKPIGRNLVEEGLITEKNKLTVTSQALTNWAKSKGIDAKKKRTSAIELEKTKHQETKKELDRLNRKNAQLEVDIKHKTDEIKLIRQSKQESDKIRQQLGKDNLSLREKLKACLGDKK